ncbi:MAG: tRNA glutamyl-Q(34) synthetase GluQRS [Gammaproteobacteria bacterium]|nr:tRNA glutamyl-Q(34) synthetase GluQRS [Gammaproteobacteria bacterium]NNJ50180.1 tRNA glutamyl-Q(34) synthetase GluQRS [Gammaproteobacteria bacterium]
MDKIINADKYIGRFAPSPTGPVHFGTLLAAVGSYLQAKKNNGDWIIRMEDVDITRKVDGSDLEILHTLEAFGFEWQGEVLYQSKQTECYRYALEQLIEQSLVFPCICSRKQLVESGSGIYPGTCRTRSLQEKSDHALRLLAEDITIEFDDLVMGRRSQNMASQCGDFVIKRRDGLFAYQLAVVVDDQLQDITEVVRGADLLDSTPRQIYLQQLLGYSTPGYCHLPLAVDAAGNKISKSEGAARVDIKNRESLLRHVLDFLGQKPPADLCDADISEIWKWATEHWDIDLVSAANKIPLHT